MRLGHSFRAAVTAGAATALLGLALALPSAASATRVGLGAETQEPSRCFSDQQNAYASTSCQLFYGAPLRIISLASRDEGGVRLEPQPFTLFGLRRDGAPTPVASFTVFDENDADDNPLVVPAHSTDYELRFNGNTDMPPGTSATMVVDVGARLTIPPDAASGEGTGLRVPTTVVVPERALRGRIELRRCHRTKATSARSCAKGRDYTVLARRSADRSRRVSFKIAAPPRSMGRYEIAFRPESKRFATTRQAFEVINGFDGLISYRPTVRSSPFGNR